MAPCTAPNEQVARPLSSHGLRFLEKLRARVRGNVCWSCGWPTRK